MNVFNDSEDSDTSDEEYVPGKKPEDVSEEESDGVPEDDLDDIPQTKKTNHRSKKRRKKEIPNAHETEEKCENRLGLSDEAKKKEADDVWADFMKDTGFQSKKARLESDATKGSLSTGKNKEREKKVHDGTDKIKITQTFEFAGEKVSVEKEVARNSVEAKSLSKKSLGTSKNSSSSGLSSVLGQLGKKSKISTLEKSKLDWDRFKKEENLEEELHSYNKGKDGYLERQDFLQRADERRFEIEKQIRTVERNKRVN